MSNLTDFYKIESNFLSDYKSDQTIIINRKYLKEVSRIQLKPSCHPQTPRPTSVDWYPFTNSYYSHTEDVDVYSRVNHLLSTVKSCETLTAARDCAECTCQDDGYSEKSSQLQYLSSTPTSFLILGKSDIGEQQLGKLLAEYWKCVYIEPETLILDEIESETRAGQCIEFNLRNGRAIGADVVLKLLEKRVKSKSAQHRGFVICGFPMVPNDLYEEEPITSEATVFNVRDLFEEIIDTTITVARPPEPTKFDEAQGEFEENAGEAEEADEQKSVGTNTNKHEENKTPIDLGSEASDVCISGSYDNDIEEQLNFIFGQFQKPFVIIYMVCSNGDVISKHKGYRFDVHSKQIFDVQLELADKRVYTYFTQVPGVGNDELPEDFIDVIKNNRSAFNDSQQRQLVSLPRDFPSNMVALLDRYRQYALPTIERHVLMHDPQNIIKVDGRISVVRIFHAVKQRLHVLPLQKVILPEKLIVASDAAGEASPTEELDFGGLTHDECFAILCKKQIVSSMFKWTWSDWGTKCPVLMADGVERDGDPQYAVRFMNKIFFLANEETYIKFRRNPRPYLSPPYPKTNCRIFVMGPRCSGKSAVARCLGYVFKGQVLNYAKMLHDFLAVKFADYESALRRRALETALELLNAQRQREWEERERERMEKIEEWIFAQHAAIKQRIKIMQAIGDTNVVVLDISSFATQLSYSDPNATTGSRTSISSLPIQQLKEMLAELQDSMEIPPLSGVSDYEELLTDNERLCAYLPEHLRPLPPVEPASSTDVFVVNYVEDASQNASYEGIELTNDHKAELLIGAIKELEERKSGWVVDGMLPNQELFEKIYSNYIADFIIVLKDEDHAFLVDRYKFRGRNEFRDFRKLFEEIGEEEAEWRSPSLTSTDTFKQRLAKYVLDDVLDDTCTSSDTDEEHNPRLANINAYKKELNRFDEDFSHLSPTLVSYQISVIEVSVTGKTQKNLLKDVIRTVQNRYRQTANVFTELDRAQELEDFGEPDLQSEEAVEAEETADNTDTFFQNRRFGDTFIYCPVTFHNHYVLWKGKEEFTASFENKLYLMCSESAMNEFIEEPRRYLPLNQACDVFPPPRICIVGPDGCGKSTVAASLSRNLGLCNFTYEHLLKLQIAPRSKLTLHDFLKLGIGGEQAEKVKNYLASDEALDEALLKTIVPLLWFGEREKTFGFVLSGFPKRPSDVAFMLRQCTIPDIIVELSINQGEIRDRLIHKFLAIDSKQILTQRRNEVIDDWQQRRALRFQELLMMKKRESAASKRRYMEDLTEIDEGAELLQASPDDEEELVKEVEELLATEFPMPVFEDELDDASDEALERFANEIEDAFASELNFLRVMREQCDAELIPWITVDAGTSPEKVFAQVMRVVEPYKFRKQSLFERVYEVSVDLSDKLLSTGYYFLSKFGKCCPVQVYEDQNPILMYRPAQENFQLYPVIHRQYIYFVVGQESVNEFKENPLKYTMQKFVSNPLLPLRLAILGPPKSGKTVLAQRFKREFGLQVISRGKAARYVLKYLSFSELAEHLESALRFGWELSDEMVVKAAEAFAFDGRCITQGFVMDGFSMRKEEVRYLAAVGLIPHLVIELRAEQATVREFRAGDVARRNLPVFSQQFIDHRYETYEKQREVCTNWLRKEYQVNAFIGVTPCRWWVWRESCELATAVFSEVKFYYQNAFRDCALRLGYMQITPLEFVQRQSAYKSYCPCCLFFENVLMNGGNPPDRTGVVQFRHFFYYLCNDHIETFLSTPEKFISPYNPRQLPSDLPERAQGEATQCEFYADGNCIVCYWKNRPNRVVKQGRVDLAVTYREKTYLFDDQQCMEEFMREPRVYFAIAINYKGIPYPPMYFHDLPIPGYLQQYDVQQLIKAINNTGILRPIIPGLSTSTSAAVNIGLYLKINNPKTSPQYLPLYKEAQMKLNERRLNLMKYLEQMKNMINPYLYYDEPLSKYVDHFASNSSLHDSDTETTALSTTNKSEMTELADGDVLY